MPGTGATLKKWQNKKEHHLLRLWYLQYQQTVLKTPTEKTCGKNF